MKLFHINTDCPHNPHRPMQVGDQLHIGNSVNPYFAQIEKSATRVGSGINQSDALRHYSMMLREFVFENVRAETYPELPSRMRGLWLAASFKVATSWLTRIPHHGQKRIVELELLEGKLHESNEEHLSNDLLNAAEHRKMAEAYWRGTKGNGRAEILVEGQLRVLFIHA